MKISIITPTYNQAEFIEDAIKSVLDQEDSNFEHIIVDGGSSDQTISILRKYPHLKWISEKDNGQSDAINKGIQLSTGDIVGWLNSDDIYLPGTLSRVRQEFATDKIDGTYANLYFSDRNLQIQDAKVTYPPVPFIALFRCYIPSETLFVRKKVFEDGLRIDENLHITMDKDLVYALLHKGYKLKYTNTYGAIFRRHETNKSKNSAEVKRLTTKEGIFIINKHYKLQIPYNRFTHMTYRTCLFLVSAIGFFIKKTYHVMYGR
jgi:glycosyltransferase involved in cell wall biosynthesis